MSLLELIPAYLREYREYQGIFDAFDIQFDGLSGRLTYMLKQSSIMGADESRIEEWEAFLQIAKQGDLYQRKQFIVATLTSVGKLNERKIEDVVNIYTNGGGCIVEVTDKAIIVKVKPPKGSEIFLFPDVERTLDRMKPAHLALYVIRYYATIGQLEGKFLKILNVEQNFLTIKEMEVWTND